MIWRWIIVLSGVSMYVFDFLISNQCSLSALTQTQSQWNLDYRHACRPANRLIYQSRLDHMWSELETCNDPRQCWLVAERLLHTDNGPAKQPSVTDDISLCEQFADYLCLKLNSCTLTLYVNCLTHNSCSLCLLDLYVLANYLTPVLSLLVRFPNSSPP